MKWLIGVFILAYITLAAVLISCASEPQPQPAIIMFTAEYCGPCKKAARHLISEKKAGHLKGIKIYIVDVEKEPDWASAFDITRTPTFIVGYINKPIKLWTSSVYEAIAKAKELRDDS